MPESAALETTSAEALPDHATAPAGTVRRPAHGGCLVDRMAPPEEARLLRERALTWPSWGLTPRQLCDLELLLAGGFSPLQGFLERRDYDPVCAESRLASGLLWPIPVTLDVPAAVARSAAEAGWLVLRDPEGVPLAVLEVRDLWEPDREAEARAVLGTTDPTHPGVAHLLHKTEAVYLGGPVHGLKRPVHHDFRALRQTPAEVRAHFDAAGWDRVVAFQTRNPLHRAHHALTRRAMEEHGAGLLLHPVVGLTKPGDVDHFTRVKCYRHVLAHYPEGTAVLSLLPLAMRMGGPREALWHALIRKNFGATHFIVGRDHAGPGADREGRPFYGPYEARDRVVEHQGEIGIRPVPFDQMVFAPGRGAYVTVVEAAPGEQTLDLSGTELRQRLAEGREIPAWFTFPEVARELAVVYPPRRRQGLTVFFTGLSGAGKSTLANRLLSRLLEHGDRPVTVLDGDLVRQHLSSELGFSKRDRDLNVRRIGFVAAEITRHGGIAVCAPIAPYDEVRREVREMVEGRGGFVLVYLATPLEVCEARDRKGLYARARAGLIPEFTGISDPYEPPEDASVVIDTSRATPEEGVDLIIEHLVREGYLVTC